MVRFAHLADLHLGGWRDEKLKSLGLEAFKLAVDRILEESVDFVIISGDTFDTALPSIDSVKHASVQLARLRDNDIPVYIIAGSHDYSASGRSMLDVLEGAGLVRNVQRAVYGDEGSITLEFTVDRTGVKLTGLPGKKGALEEQYYDVLDRESARRENGVKIFLFHMLLTEFRRARDDRIPATPSSVLPKGFAYYAGGHPHLVDHKRFDSGIIAYPGPLFPNNFEELEDLGSGGFYLVDLDTEELEWVRILTRQVTRIEISFDGSPKELEQELHNSISRHELAGSIVLVRVSGTLTGPVSEVDWGSIHRTAIQQGAYTFAKNTYNLESSNTIFETPYASQSEVESDIVESFSQTAKAPSVLGEDVFERLFRVLHTRKQEGETNTDYERRVCTEFFSEFEL